MPTQEITGLTDRALLRLLQAEDGGLENVDKQDPTVFAGLRVITRNIAALNLEVWDGPDPATRKKASGAGAERLRRLLRKPAPWLGGRDLRKLLVWNQVLDGEATLVLRDGVLDPLEKETERPSFLTVHGRKHVRFEHRPGKRVPSWYVTRQWMSGVQDPVPMHALVQVKDPDPDNEMRGLGVRGALRVTAGISWATRTYLHAFFRNGAEAGLYFSPQFPLGKKQVEQWMRQWEQRHGGPKQSNRPSMLPFGVEPRNVQQSHREQDVLAILKHTRLDTLMVIGVPESELGMIKDATYSNGLSANAGFWIQTLLPIVYEEEESLNDPTTRLAERFGPGLYIAYDLTRVKQILEHVSSKIDAYTKLVHGGIPVNAAKDLLGLDTPDVVGGDVPLIQAQLGPLEIIATGEHLQSQKATSSPGDQSVAKETKSGTKSVRSGRRSDLRARRRIERLLAQSELHAVRVFRGMMTDMRRRQLEILDDFEAREGRSSDQRGILEGELESAVVRGSEFEQPLVDAMTEEFEIMLSEAADLVATEVGRSLSVFDLQHPQVTAYTERMLTQVKGVPDTVQQRLSEALSEGIAENEPVRVLKQRVRETMNAEAKRAETIAQVTSGEAVSGGRYLAMDLEGVASSEWSTAGDAKVRHSHAAQDGEVVRIGETFSNGLRFPLDPRGPADEVIGCRCAALAVE